MNNKMQLTKRVRRVQSESTIEAVASISNESTDYKITNKKQIFMHFVKTAKDQKAIENEMIEKRQWSVKLDLRLCNEHIEMKPNVKLRGEKTAIDRLTASSL